MHKIKINNSTSLFCENNGRTTCRSNREKRKYLCLSIFCRKEDVLIIKPYFTCAKNINELVQWIKTNLCKHKNEWNKNYWTLFYSNLFYFKMFFRVITLSTAWSFFLLHKVKESSPNLKKMRICNTHGLSLPSCLSNIDIGSLSNVKSGPNSTKPSDTTIGIYF